MVSRRYEEAIEQYRLLLEFEPSFTKRGRHEGECMRKWRLRQGHRDVRKGSPTRRHDC